MKKKRTELFSKFKLGSILAVSVALAALLALMGCSGQKASSSSANANSTQGNSPVVHVASLKGPTSIGIAQLIDDAESGKTSYKYEFTVSGTADEVLPKLIQGDVDIALIPANAAATVYNKTQGKVSVIDINTLGVLYVVSADASINSINSLAGHTVYMTGAGTTPEYVMRYLLDKAGIADSVTLEFRSEASEVAAIINSDPSAIAVLPEPYVTSVGMKNESLAPRVSLTDAWNELQQESGSQLVTGVTVVRSEFAKEHPDIVEDFLKRQSDSVATVNADPAKESELVVKAGIMESAKAAEKAIPNCNLVCITGKDMKSALSGYLSVLHEQDVMSIGGELPKDDFYYGA